MSLTLQKLKRRPAKNPGKLKPLNLPNLHFELNEQQKLNLLRNENELLFLDELTQEDKFYLIQSIESKITSSSRYDHKKPEVRDSLEVIEDCAEDLEDEVVTPSKPSHGDATPTNIFDEP